MERQAFIHGIYPRSERLIASGRGLDRGRVSALEHSATQVEEANCLIALQKTCGFGFVEDGKFTWQDIFRPFADSTKGIEAGSLTRWFDTNTFFRQPVITGKPILDPEKFDVFIPTIPGIEQKVTLPSPLTFARLCADRRQVDFVQTLTAVTGLLVSTVAHLEKRGIKAVQFNEPYFAYASQEEDVDYLFKSVSDVIGSSNILSIIHCYFGDGAPLLRAFEQRESSVDVVGVDFYKTKIADVPRGFSKVLLAGVIDSQSSLAEDRAEIEQFIEQLSQQARPTKLYLTSNCDLEFVPQDIANQKVVLLGELIK